MRLINGNFSKRLEWKAWPECQSQILNFLDSSYNNNNNNNNNNNHVEVKTAEYDKIDESYSCQLSFQLMQINIIPT